MLYCLLVLGSATEVFHTEDGTFSGIFHQDARMRQTYAAFPEVLLCDATYKLTDLRMPLYLMLGIDGNGHSQVVAMYLTTSETAADLAHMLEVCDKRNDVA